MASWSGGWGGWGCGGGDNSGSKMEFATESKQEIKYHNCSQLHPRLDQQVQGQQ